jgi:hypothetical protein
MSFGTMDAVLMNCECMASVGAATQLYVRFPKTRVCDKQAYLHVKQEDSLEKEPE